MATFTIMMIATMVFAQALAKPQINSNTIGSTIKPPASLSYSEILYIFQTRHGLVDPKQKPKILSSCARAILGCCRDNKMNEACSESLHCGAFFFDENPCEEKFIVDALKAAKSFYQQFEQPKD